MTIVFRCDAGPNIGIGHVMRCLALAEAVMARGRRVVFAAAELPDGLRQRLAEAGAEVAAVGAEAADLLALLSRRQAAACVLDGYQFDENYRLAARQDGVRVLAMDDTGELGRLHADIVVNPSAHGHDLPYDRIAAGATLLIGPEFVLLRSEFNRRIAAGPPDLAARRRILISFGGSDPAGLSGPVTAALANASVLDAAGIDVAVGAAHPDLAALRSQILGKRVRLHIDARDMAALMAGAGLAISAGGGTIAELAALGVPTLLVVVAANQAAAASDTWCEVAAASDGAEAIARRALVLWRDFDRRAAMAERARGAVDGRGAGRVADVLLEGLREPLV